MLYFSAKLTSNKFHTPCIVPKSNTTPFGSPVVPDVNIMVHVSLIFGE